MEKDKPEQDPVKKESTPALDAVTKKDLAPEQSERAKKKLTPEQKAIGRARQEELRTVDTEDLVEFEKHVTDMAVKVALLAEQSQLSRAYEASIGKIKRYLQGMIPKISDDQVDEFARRLNDESELKPFFPKGEWSSAQAKTLNRMFRTRNGLEERLKHARYKYEEILPTVLRRRDKKGGEKESSEVWWPERREDRLVLAMNRVNYKGKSGKAWCEQALNYLNSTYDDDSEHEMITPRRCWRIVVKHLAALYEGLRRVKDDPASRITASELAPYVRKRAVSLEE